MSKPWPTVRLGEVLTHDQRYIDQPEFRAYPKLSVKLYGKGVVLDTPADGGALKMQRHQLARPGQVILSEIWGKKGAIGFVPSEGDGALCTSHFFLFDVNGDKLDPKWLQAIFTANYLQTQLDAEAKGTTGYAAVRPKILLACEIPLPPLAEQRRVVARIEELAAQIQEARLLQDDASMQVGVLRASTLRSFLQRSPYPEVALGTVCDAIIDNLHSNPRYSDTGIPCVRSPDVGWGTLNLQSALRTDEEEYHRRTIRGQPKPNDIILVREGGGTGKCARVLPDQRFSLGQRVMMLRPNQGVIDPAYFLYQLLSPLIQEEQIAPMTKGSAAPHLNIGALRHFRVRLPPLCEQRQIVAELDALQAKTDAVKGLQADSAIELDALMPAILDRAFRGLL